MKIIKFKNALINTKYVDHVLPMKHGLGYKIICFFKFNTKFTSSEHETKPLYHDSFALTEYYFKVDEVHARLKELSFD